MNPVWVSGFICAHAIGVIEVRRAQNGVIVTAHGRDWCFATWDEASTWIGKAFDTGISWDSNPAPSSAEVKR